MSQVINAITSPFKPPPCFPLIHLPLPTPARTLHMPHRKKTERLVKLLHPEHKQILRLVFSWPGLFLRNWAFELEMQGFLNYSRHGSSLFLKLKVYNSQKRRGFLRKKTPSNELCMHDDSLFVAFTGR